ncbi:ABC-type transport system, involved in lipoprotein release, permease component [Candidatus Electrothrix marina]|uniref:ABC-type transport system, involved in lipoprotein release, permease component n=1 Tax=Candidatus Electrothrix marina TaxID=1859130 RepID=A0A444JDN3_9BACT|nr:ABC-type transport system, involved in lipoprotein release, permease component [Candidatus Electrothrix marina]
MFSLIIKIARASLARRGLRSLLVILMIAVSLWGLLLIEGVYEGMIEQMINNAIRSDSGHLSLFARDYRSDPDLSRQVHEVSAIKAALEQDTRVRSFAERIKQDGLAATAHASRGAVIIGMDLEKEEQHGRLAEYLQKGEFSFGKKGKGIILGFKLADTLRVRIGSKIILSAQDMHAEVASAAFRVTGILKTNNMGLDERAVFIDLNKMRKMLIVPEGVSQIAVIVHEQDQLAEVQEDLHTRFPDLDILRWDELYPALMQSKVIMDGFNMVISGMIFCVAALGIFGVILVSVLERIREFGIMLAIGTRFGLIRNIILAESFFLGLIGFVFGSLIGGANLYYFKIYGLDLSAFSDAFDEFGMDAITYAVIRPSYFLTAFVAVLLATFFSVLIPLRVLKKSNPIEAINKV